MCDDLQTAIHTQEELGTDTTKGAMMLIKAAATSIKKSQTALQKHIAESEEKMTRIEQKVDVKLSKIDKKVDDLTKSFEAYKMDATKYQLIVEVCRALFGSVKRTVLTFVVFGVLMGFVHMSEILDLLKAML